MLVYTIQCIDREKNQIYFAQVKGYKLPNGFAAHKSDKTNTWTLDDLNSGCKVQEGFRSYSNLKAILDASDIQKKVFARRKTERYALLVRRNREKKIVKLEKKIEERKEELWDN